MTHLWTVPPVALPPNACGCAADGALLALGRIAAAAGARLICEGPFSRVDRGAGRPRITRLPYFPQESQKLLSSFEVLVLAGAGPPVAQFGYRWDQRPQLC